MDSSSRYRVLRLIGSGGMAQVYEGTLVGARGFERRVAIKRVLPQHAHDEAMCRMFLNEAQLASRLNHSNIAQVFDFGLVDGTEFIVMEFVDGVDLARAARHGESQGDPITEGVALYIVGEVARALGHAHGYRDEHGKPCQIVHRDVSPQNVLLSWSAEVKLSDFGIAVAATRAERTRTGVIKGKASFMAPEQATGERVTSAVDIYALGRTLEVLVQGNGDGSTPRPLSAPVADIQRRCTSLEPAARLTARELAELAGRLSATLLEADPCSTLHEWLDRARPQLSRRSALDEMYQLALVPLGQRHFTVSRTPTATGESDPGDDATKSPATRWLGPATPDSLAPSPPVTRRRRLWLALMSGVLVAGIVALLFVTGRENKEQRAENKEQRMQWASEEQVGPRGPGNNAAGAVAGSPQVDPPTPRDGTAGAATTASATTRKQRKVRADRRSRKKTRARPPAKRSASSKRRDETALGPPQRAWIRIGGETLAGAAVRIDGAVVGYAPLEYDLEVGAHVIMIRDAASGKRLLKRRVVLAPHHTRRSPLRLIRSR